MFKRLLNCCCCRCALQWRLMGWQQDDPTTDFRAAGLLGLTNLVDFATHHPEAFHNVMEKKSGVRVELEYPFAAAGINLTVMLLDLIGLLRRGQAQRPSTPVATRSSAIAPEEAICIQPSAAARGYLQLVTDAASGHMAFLELYCTAFVLLDSVWLDMKASYMQFPQVLKVVRDSMERALAAQPATVGDVRQRLKVSMAVP